jgi:DNA-binding MarR family transcriptional regulator
MSLADLDPVIHPPKRLAAMAILHNSSAADFAFLRNHLGVSDSDLSKQMSTLEKAGYVKVTKTSRGRGGATWYRITLQGAKAFRRHMDALNALAAQAVEQAAEAERAQPTESAQPAEPA